MWQTVRSWRFSFRSFCTAFITYSTVIGDCMVAFTSGDDFMTITVPIAATLSPSNVLWKCSVKCSQMSGCAVNCLPHSVSMVVMVCRLLFSATVRWKKEPYSVSTNSSRRSFVCRHWVVQFLYVEFSIGSIYRFVVVVWGSICFPEISHARKIQVTWWPSARTLLSTFVQEEILDLVLDVNLPPMDINCIAVSLPPPVCPSMFGAGHYVLVT